MTEEPETTDVKEYEFNADSMILSSTLVDARQEGNFLVGKTDQGVEFRHRIPAGKMLNKNEKGDWILQDLNTI